MWQNLGIVLQKKMERGRNIQNKWKKIIKPTIIPNEKNNKYSTFIHASFVPQHLAKILTDCLSQTPWTPLRPSRILRSEAKLRLHRACLTEHSSFGGHIRRAVVADRGDGLLRPDSLYSSSTTPTLYTSGGHWCVMCWGYTRRKWIFWTPKLGAL